MSKASKKETLNELESKINGLERSNFDLKLRLHYLNSKYGHLENNDSRNGGYGEYDLRDEIQNLTEENEYYKQKILELETEVLRLQVAREKEMEKYQEALRMKPAAAQQAEEQRKRERDVSLAIAEHDATLIAKLQEELQQLHTDRAGHQMLVSDLNEKINKLVQLADDKDTEIDSLVKTVRDMRNTIDALTQEQQKLANLTDAVTRPIVVTTNASGQQTSVTLNAAGTNINTQNHAQNPLPPIPLANSTYNPNPYASAYLNQTSVPTTSTTTTTLTSNHGVQPAAQSINVTQQGRGAQQSSVSIVATPGRPSLGGATNSVTISSNTNNQNYMNSLYRTTSAMPLGAVRGASTTAGLQHTLNNPIVPPATPAHSSLPHHYSHYPASTSMNDTLSQSLHASALMPTSQPSQQQQQVSFTQSYAPVEAQPQGVTFTSTLPDGSPVRTTVTTSQINPQHTVIEVSSIPTNSTNFNGNSQYTSMQQQFQQSLHQASMMDPAHHTTTSINAAGAGATTMMTTTMANDPMSGQPYQQHHIQIQQQQQQQQPQQVYVDPAQQSRLDALQQSISVTEKVIQQLRQNAHELSLIDQDEVNRLENELQKTVTEKEQLKRTSQFPSSAASATTTGQPQLSVPLTAATTTAPHTLGKGAMSVHELSSNPASTSSRYPTHIMTPSFENNPPPALYDIPSRSPLRASSSLPRYGTAAGTTGYYNQGNATNVLYSTNGYPPAVPPTTMNITTTTTAAPPPLPTGHLLHSSYLPPSTPVTTTTVASSSPYRTSIRNINGTTVSVTSSTPVVAPPSSAISGANSSIYHHPSAVPLSSSYASVYRPQASTVISNNSVPPVTTTVTTTTSGHGAGTAGARTGDVSTYERTIDLYKSRENELLSALEGVVKRVQELEENGDGASRHRHNKDYDDRRSITSDSSSHHNAHRSHHNHHHQQQQYHSSESSRRRHARDENQHSEVDDHRYSVVRPSSNSHHTRGDQHHHHHHHQAHSSHRTSSATSAARTSHHSHHDHHNSPPKRRPSSSSSLSANSSTYQQSQYNNNHPASSSARRR